jgi:hypothetical protein
MRATAETIIHELRAKVDSQAAELRRLKLQPKAGTGVDPEALADVIADVLKPFVERVEKAEAVMSELRELIQSRVLKRIESIEAKSVTVGSSQ